MDGRSSVDRPEDVVDGQAIAARAGAGHLVGPGCRYADRRQRGDLPDLRNVELCCDPVAVERAELVNCQTERVRLETQVRDSLPQVVVGELKYSSSLSSTYTRVKFATSRLAVGAHRDELRARCRVSRSCTASPRRPMMNAQGWELPADGARRAASSSTSISGSVTACRTSNASGLNRSRENDVSSSGSVTVR